MIKLLYKFIHLFIRCPALYWQQSISDIAPNSAKKWLLYCNKCGKIVTELESKLETSIKFK
jgi:hypothetical protein